MKKEAFLLAAACAALGAAAQSGLSVTADRIAADQRTGSLVASGHVNAVSHPFRLLSEEFSRDANGVTKFSAPTTFTTCTNECGHMHWRATGGAEYLEGRYVGMNDMWLYLWEIPVAWMPYWRYPLDTDYGLRFMPGYTSKWGGYLLTKYVYRLAGNPSDPDAPFGLRGASRLDLRTKNGVALGQSLDWGLGDFGRGGFRVYNAWDLDHDRYSRHWNDKKHENYKNWGSEVEYRRWAVDLHHRWEPTERDVIRGRGAVYSDSHFRNDFLREHTLTFRNRFLAGYTGNELAWEHNESLFGLGVSVSGPLNDFYDGVARLPELYFDISPQPVLSLPVNYESSSRIGYLDRMPAEYGGSKTPRTAYSRRPGAWADYNTFRMDSYHRLSAPFKVADVLSVVPRFGFRGTYWSDSGYTSVDGWNRAGSSGDYMARAILEGGVTFAARGTAWIDDRWQHVVEPYLDVLAQEAWYNCDGAGRRPYIFDNVDGTTDWQDQFAGRSRELPYSWYGFTPGFRNMLRRADETGRLSSILDLDVYAAVQLNKSDWTGGNRYHRLAKVGEPNYGKDSPTVTPGVRARWSPAPGTSLSARTEYDCEYDKLALASVRWDHRLSSRLSWYAEVIHRDHRWWDYSSTPYDRKLMRNEDFNWAYYSFVEVGFEQEICDAFAWGPYIRWDCREGEFEEIGSWFDYRTDCLGFRLKLSYENSYKRLDGSEHEEDWRIGFYVYLRAFGPDMGDMF